MPKDFHFQNRKTRATAPERRYFVSFLVAFQGRVETTAFRGGATGPWECPGGLFPISGTRPPPPYRPCWQESKEKNVGDVKNPLTIWCWNPFCFLRVLASSRWTGFFNSGFMCFRAFFASPLQACPTNKKSRRWKPAAFRSRRVAVSVLLQPQVLHHLLDDVLVDLLALEQVAFQQRVVAGGVDEARNALG